MTPRRLTDAEIGSALKAAHEDGWRPTGYHTHSREIEPGLKDCVATMTLAEMYADNDEGGRS